MTTLAFIPPESRVYTTHLGIVTPQNNEKMTNKNGLNKAATIMEGDSAATA